MTILSRVYSGHTVDDPLIPCLEIFSDGFPDRILNCNGFEDQTVALETGEVVTFIASGMDVALPAKDASGQQMLRFAIENVTDNGYRLVKESMDAGHSIRLVYREYLASDLSAPAKAPLRMIVTQPEIGRAHV